jgi:hypothetical protein
VEVALCGSQQARRALATAQMAWTVELWSGRMTARIRFFGSLCLRLPAVRKKLPRKSLFQLGSVDLDGGRPHVSRRSRHLVRSRYLRSLSIPTKGGGGAAAAAQGRSRDVLLS